MQPGWDGRRDTRFDQKYPKLSARYDLCETVRDVVALSGKLKRSLRTARTREALDDALVEDATTPTTVAVEWFNRRRRDELMPRPTKVIFRRWRTADGSVIAIFPDLAGGDQFPSGQVMMYEHVGQHGGGDYIVVMKRTRPAKEDDADVVALRQELEGRGYVLRVRTRATHDTLGGRRR